MLICQNTNFIDRGGACTTQKALTLLLRVPTDEDGNDDIEIVTNEEIPECSVASNEDQHTNLENDLDSDGNSTNGCLVSSA